MYAVRTGRPDLDVTSCGELPNSASLAYEGGEIDDARTTSYTTGGGRPFLTAEVWESSQTSARATMNGRATWMRMQKHVETIR
jgi:hypothetical protein